jgi:nucleoside-diphosphate-sugar epimerase
MLDAAAAAGVKRVIPSEFSSNLEAKVKETKLPNVSEKLKIRDYIEGLASQGKIEWSSVNNGPFFDLGVKMGFIGPHLQSKTATFHNGGDIPVCATSTDDIAEAVALVLQHPEETRNKPVYVYSALVTERKVTDVVSKLTGIEFKIVQADIQKGANEYLDLLKKGQDDPRLRFNLYFLMMYGAGYGGNYTDIAMNKTLGLRVMGDTEIERKIGDWLEEAGVEVRR